MDSIVVSNLIFAIMGLLSIIIFKENLVVIIQTFIFIIWISITIFININSPEILVEKILIQIFNMLPGLIIGDFIGAIIKKNT